MGWDNRFWENQWAGRDKVRTCRGALSNVYTRAHGKLDEVRGRERVHWPLRVGKAVERTGLDGLPKPLTTATAMVEGCTHF